MSEWDVAIEPAGPAEPPAQKEDPIFLALARTITSDIQRGRLAAGACMPGSREFARTMGVHRNTALAAYRELIAEGWLFTEPRRGTFVAQIAPEALEGAAGRARKTVDDAPPFELPALAADAPLPSATAMTLGGGVPDVRLFPAEALARAMRRAMRRRPLEVLGYGDPAGPLALRRAIASMVAATRGVAATEANVLIVRGAQMGLDLVARTLVSPGDTVAVEAFGYRPAWEALSASGATLAPVAVDAHGLQVDSLRSSSPEIRGLYLTPHHQYPTTVTLEPGRRMALLALARKRRFWILEDDYDHEFHYEGRPVLPLASADRHGSVIYVGTFSKVLAPGLRLGFVVAATPVIERLARTRRFIDRQGDHTLAAAVAELIEDGEIQRHIWRTRRIYAERRERTLKLLKSTLGDAIDFTPPSGGTAVWAKIDPAISVDEWARVALEKHDLVLQPGQRFAFDGRSRNFFRLGFAQHDDREAKEAVKRLKAAMPRPTPKRR